MCPQQWRGGALSAQVTLLEHSVFPCYCRGHNGWSIVWLAEGLLPSPMCLPYPLRRGLGRTQRWLPGCSEALLANIPGFQPLALSSLNPREQVGDTGWRPHFSLELLSHNTLTAPPGPSLLSWDFFPTMKGGRSVRQVSGYALPSWGGPWSRW